MEIEFYKAVIVMLLFGYAMFQLGLLIGDVRTHEKYLMEDEE